MHFLIFLLFAEIMRATKDNPNVLQAGTTPGLLKTFQSNNVTLEKIHKSLEEYPHTLFLQKIKKKNKRVFDLL